MDPHCATMLQTLDQLVHLVPKQCEGNATGRKPQLVGEPVPDKRAGYGIDDPVHQLLAFLRVLDAATNGAELISALVMSIASSDAGGSQIEPTRYIWWACCSSVKRIVSGTPIRYPEYRHTSWKLSSAFAIIAVPASSPTVVF